MAFVFWDTETTGTSTDFDQILQFAAVRTDDEFNELDRFEIRCRLQPHIAPSPYALVVTGVTIGKITDTALPCHYEMVGAIREKLESWSPAVFIGYNSYRFDEELLRKAFFRTLHPPYLTNSMGNGRADALLMVQACSAHRPECLRIPLGENGKVSFKLDRLAPLNGFAHEHAHDALDDAFATIHLVRMIKSGAPDIYERFVGLSRKADTLSFLRAQPALLLTEFLFNRPFHYPVAPIALDPGNPSKVLAVDLRHDVDEVAGLSGEELLEWIETKPRPVRGIKLNAPPALAPLGEVDNAFFAPFDPELLMSRARRLRADKQLRDRLATAHASGAPEYETSEHVEEQLYSGGFVQGADTARMARFHLGSWAERAQLAEQFEDERLRYHALRIVFEEHAHLLPEAVRASVGGQLWQRLLQRDCPSGKWCSLHKALADTQTLLAEPGRPAALLLELQTYLKGRLNVGSQFLGWEDPPAATSNGMPLF